MNIIEIENLTHDYGNNKGIFDISMSVKESEIFGFLGPNGAGKTTTIRHLMGFIKPNSGKCCINSFDCFHERCKIQEFVGYIPGEINFFDDMTGVEYLNFMEKYRKIKNGSLKKSLLEMFELDPKGKIKKMSKGMKQKVGIVSAFMHDPQVLILDEPTSGLDPIMQKRFIELIQREKSKGKTIFISSHIFEEVEKTCDRISIIKDGKLAATDSTEELHNRHVKKYTVTLENEKTAEDFARDFSGIQKGNTVEVTARQSLEEIFLQYYGGGKNDK